MLDTKEINATSWKVLVTNKFASSNFLAPQFLATKAVVPANIPERIAWITKVILWPVIAAATSLGPKLPTTFIATIDPVAYRRLVRIDGHASNHTPVSYTHLRAHET